MKRILVTGGAGFIGSNLIDRLLKLRFEVVCLDNLITGSRANIEEFENNRNFEFVEGDILDSQLLNRISSNCQLISHQAALGSVPRSIKDPILSNRINVEGTLNVFKAAVDNKIERVVYAASSSTYGDSQTLPKREDAIGKPLSPYAVTKYVNELYAEVFHRVYGLNTVGLRYFNVFGPKQNPSGPYAAVIPIFIQKVLNQEPPVINGDGENTRDFTFVENAIDANIKAINAHDVALNKVYNVACGERTSLNELLDLINNICSSKIVAGHGPERGGDVKHSLADISRAQKMLSYEAKISLKKGLEITVNWYKAQRDG